MPTKAFTFIEIMITVSIVGILIAASANTYKEFSKQSRDTKRTSDLNEIQQALEMYRSNNPNGLYPTPCPITQNCPNGLPFGTGSLSSSDGNVYLQLIPKDPKDNNYRYITDSTTSPKTYRLCSTLEKGAAEYVLDPYGKAESCSTSTIALGPTLTPTPVPGIVPLPIETCGARTIDTSISLGAICL